ncbi:MAG: sirohydrochlorin chelatase, partial [Gemmataceae bacterium]
VYRLQAIALHYNEENFVRSPGDAFVKTALLLIAHGSRQETANADLLHVAAALRQCGWPIVVASFLELAEPGIEDGGVSCVEQGAECVILVPYFLSAGVHVRRDLSEARMKLAERYPGVAFRLAEPLGRHPLLLDVVAERVREAIDQAEPRP